MVPDDRIRRVNRAGPNPEGAYVLYWMIAFRRTSWNFSLQRAAWWAQRFQRPLLIFEGRRAGHPQASERLHRFVIAGMENVCKSEGVFLAGIQIGRKNLDELSRKDTLCLARGLSVLA